MRTRRHTQGNPYDADDDGFAKRKNFNRGWSALQCAIAGAITQRGGL